MSIDDDDDPQVTVQFEQAAYTVAEGGTQSVTVTLGADPERTVVIPLIARRNWAERSHRRLSPGCPPTVTFNAGDHVEDRSPSRATQDTVDDDGESVKLAFGTCAAGGGVRERTTVDEHGEHRPTTTTRR